MKRHVKFATFLIIITFALTPVVFANLGMFEGLKQAQEAQQAAANQLPQEAMTHIQNAQESMGQAAEMLSENPDDRSTIQAAISLYESAEEKFKKVAKMFELMGPNAVSQNDLDGVQGAIESCADAVNRLQDRLENL